MFGDYTSGMLDGMLIQGEISEKDKKILQNQAASRAFKLAINLAEKGEIDLVKRLQENPEDIIFYADLYDI